MHRPSLYRSLKSHLGEEYEVIEIQPEYAGEVLFHARVKPIDCMWQLGSIVVCVSPKHPKSMVEEDACGSQGTWWWAEDLQ